MKKQGMLNHCKQVWMLVWHLPLLKSRQPQREAGKAPLQGAPPPPTPRASGCMAGSRHLRV